MNRVPRRRPYTKRFPYIYLSDFVACDSLESEIMEIPPQFLGTNKHGNVAEYLYAMKHNYPSLIEGASADGTMPRNFIKLLTPIGYVDGPVWEMKATRALNNSHYHHGVYDPYRDWKAGNLMYTHRLDGFLIFCLWNDATGNMTFYKVKARDLINNHRPDLLAQVTGPILDWHTWSEE